MIAGTLGERAGARLLDALFSSRAYGLALGSGGSEPKFRCPDPWTGDQEVANELFRGRYIFGGESVVTAGEAPWRQALMNAGEAWNSHGHGFRWLRHFAACPGDVPRQQARGLVRSWLDLYATWDPVAWRPDFTGRRLAAWACHGHYLLDGADANFRAGFLAAFARQARHLRRAAGTAEPGARRLAAWAGAVSASVALWGPGKSYGRCLERLCREIAGQCLADGGHVSRSPAALLSVLEDLVTVRAALLALHLDVPGGLQHAIDRVAPGLRFFRHGDGGLALFNGATEGDAKAMDRVLETANAPGRPPEVLPHTGFHRLAADPTLVIVDTGGPPPRPFDGNAHAGALAFEMSVGGQRLIVNCGTPAGPLEPGQSQDEWRRACRASAAHSTLVVDDTSSCRFTRSGRVRRGPAQVEARRDDTGGTLVLEAVHDGYDAPFKLTHRRRLTLRDDGSHLAGEDSLSGPRHDGGALPFALRFHLHPEVQASLVQNGESALLRLPDGQGWKLRARGGTLALAESVYMGAAGKSRRTEQIAVTGTVGADPVTVSWELSAIRGR